MTKASIIRFQQDPPSHLSTLVTVSRNGRHGCSPQAHKYPPCLSLSCRHASSVFCPSVGLSVMPSILAGMPHTLYNCTVSLYNCTVSLYNCTVPLYNCTVSLYNCTLQRTGSAQTIQVAIRSPSSDHTRWNLLRPTRVSLSLASSTHSPTAVAIAAFCTVPAGG